MNNFIITESCVQLLLKHKADFGDNEGDDSDSFGGTLKHHMKNDISVSLWTDY